MNGIILHVVLDFFVLLSFLLSSHELPFAAGWGGDSDLG